jgi:hypothetical protein
MLGGMGRDKGGRNGEERGGMGRNGEEQGGRKEEGGRRKEEGGRRKEEEWIQGNNLHKIQVSNSIVILSPSILVQPCQLQEGHKRDGHERDRGGKGGRTEEGRKEGKEGGGGRRKEEGGRRKKGHKETTYTKFKSPIPSSSSAPPFSYSLANSNMASASPWSEASVRYFTAFARSLSTPLA